MGPKSPEQRAMEEREMKREYDAEMRDWYTQNGQRLMDVSQGTYSPWERLKNAPGDVMDWAGASRATGLQDRITGSHGASNERMEDFNQEWERAQQLGPQYKLPNTWLLMADPKRRIPIK